MVKKLRKIAIVVQSGIKFDGAFVERKLSMEKRIDKGLWVDASRE